MLAAIIASIVSHSIPLNSSFHCRDGVRRLAISRLVQAACESGIAANAFAAGVTFRRRKANIAVESDRTRDARSGPSQEDICGGGPGPSASSVRRGGDARYGTWAEKRNQRRVPAGR